MQDKYLAFKRNTLAFLLLLPLLKHNLCRCFFFFSFFEAHIKNAIHLIDRWRVVFKLNGESLVSPELWHCEKFLCIRQSKFFVFLKEELKLYGIYTSYRTRFTWQRTVMDNGDNGECVIITNIMNNPTSPFHLIHWCV